MFGEGSYEDFLNEYEGVYNSKFNHRDQNAGTLKIDALRWLNGFTLSTVPKEEIIIMETRISVATKEALLQMKNDTIRFFEMTGGVGSERPQDYIDANLLRRLIDNA